MIGIWLNGRKGLKPLTKLVIDCKNWRRGGHPFTPECGETRLLAPNGKMCCLGFECKARGLSDEDILDITTPNNAAMKLGYDIVGMTQNDMSHHSGLIQNCISSNDASIPDVQRRGELTSLFKKRGIELEFINTECGPKEICNEPNAS